MDEKDPGAVFEVQLQMMEEQLVAEMLKNQDLAAELASVRAQLEEEQMVHVEPPSAVPARVSTTPRASTMSWDDLSGEIPTSASCPDQGSSSTDQGSSSTDQGVRKGAVWASWWASCRSFVSLFEGAGAAAPAHAAAHAHAAAAAAAAAAGAGPVVAPFKFSRFRSASWRIRQAARPFLELAELVLAIHLWERPPLTILVGYVYFYAAWRGYLLAALFALGFGAMAARWVAARMGWGYGSAPRPSIARSLGLDDLDLDDDGPDDTDGLDGLDGLGPGAGSNAGELGDGSGGSTLGSGGGGSGGGGGGGGEDGADASAGGKRGLRNKYRAVLDIAARIQAAMERGADLLEKIANVFAFRAPTYSARLFGLLGAGTLVAALAPTDTTTFVIAAWLGVQFFVLRPLSLKFPRFRARYADPPLLDRLPTNLDLRVLAALSSPAASSGGRAGHPGSGVGGAAAGASVVGGLGGELPAAPLADDELNRLRVQFGIPPTERLVLMQSAARLYPNKVFRGGRGTLYLFESFIAYEQNTSNLLGIGRGRSGEARYVAAFPLESLVQVEATKAYTWFPGSGFSLRLVFDVSDAVEAGVSSSPRGGILLSRTLGPDPDPHPDVRLASASLLLGQLSSRSSLITTIRSHARSVARLLAQPQAQQSSAPAPSSSSDSSLRNRRP